MCSLKKNKKNEGEFEPATEVMSTSLSQGPDSSERSRLSWVCRHHKAPVRNTFSGSTQQYTVTVLLGDLLGRTIQFNYTILPVVTGWIKQELPQQRWFQTLPRLGQGTWQTSSLNVFWSHSRREQGLVKAQTAETERETSAASISIWLGWWGA